MSKYLIISAILVIVACRPGTGKVDAASQDSLAVPADTVVLDTVGMDTLLLND